MNTAILMFLLLTYMLFRRPASATPMRCPTELNFQVGHSICLQSETPEKKTMSPLGLGEVNRPFPQGGALAFAPGPDAWRGREFAIANDPTIQLAGVGDVSNSGKGRWESDWLA